jgi:VanZ family protein
LKGKVLKFFKRWVPLLLWIILIFGLSSIPDIHGGGIGLPSGTDKIVHFFEYAVLAYLLYRSAAYGRAEPGVFQGVAALMIGSGIALMDEYYQSFVPGRDASFFDFLSDVLGVITGNAVYYFTRAASARRFRKE